MTFWLFKGLILSYHNKGLISVNHCNTTRVDVHTVGTVYVVLTVYNISYDATILTALYL